MDSNPGKKLVKTFEKLGVNLGNCNTNAIEGWFDVDPQLNDFLTWLSDNLTEENFIHIQELEEYENNIQRKLLPDPAKFQEELDTILEKYPGILDISENEFEIECLQDELNMLQDDEHKLDDILQMHENLHIQEKLTLTELEKQKIKANREYEESEQECLNMSYSLDELNKKLYDQLMICGEKFSEYEYPSTSTHITNIPLNKYYDQYKDIISYFGLLEKREFAGIPELQSAMSRPSKLHGSIFHSKADDGLIILKEKLYRSIQNKNNNEAMKEQLKAELRFLDDFNIYEAINSLRSQQQVEGSIKFKSEHYHLLSLELKKAAIEVSEKYIDIPSIAIAKEDAKVFQNKINKIKEVENVFINILSHHTLLYMMVVINNNDIVQSDTFLRSVYNYISHNLSKCELRIEAMDSIIKQHKLYEETPFEQRCVLLQVLQGLLSEDNKKPDIDFLIKFQSKYCFANFDESLQARDQLRSIENNNKTLQCFLTNGPTSEYITIPFKLLEMFHKIDDILNTKKSVVDTSVAILNNAEKQLSENEWLRYKRQLWMNFLLRPQIVISVIEKIEKEVQKIKANALK